MKNISKILKVSILVLLFTSCSDDFISIKTENFLSSDEFYQTEDDFNSAVLGVYAKMQGNVSDYFELVERRSDNIDLGAPTAGSQDRYNINKFQETSANGLVENAWDAFYNEIFRCNSIIAPITDADFDDSLKKQFEAEARFARGLMYFNIVRFWGEAPIILRPVTSKEALTIGRSSIEEVYKVIENDLIFAQSNLPKSYPESSFGRATSGAAKALLGKVYLTQKKYSEATAVLTQLVGQYQLKKTIAEVFNPDDPSNSEIIFSIRFNKEIPEEGHGLWFAVTDVSVSPLTSKLVNAYLPNDARSKMIEYQKIGNRFAVGKFIEEESAATNSAGRDFILIRYADVLLMLSEALNGQGYSANGDAFNYLNQVRTRSLGADGAYTSADLQNQGSFQKAILNERFLEFPLEGNRWFDLIRTRTAIEEIRSGIGVNISDYQLLYPIPQTEIEIINNPEILDQNKGY